MHQEAELIQKYGKSYYLASLFLPKDIKKKVFILYDFVRIPDNVVDNKSLSLEQKTQKLQQLYEKWRYCYANKNFSDCQFGPMTKIFVEHKINPDYIDAFFLSMFMDTQIFVYTTYQQLKTYIYGSAEVVGLIMCELLGYKPAALPYAMMLGEAMQLTNFLRDIAEDRNNLGRIYMPEDLLMEYNLSHQDIINFAETKQISKNFRVFMQFMIQKCRNLYKESYLGIPHLHKGKRAVYLASKLYAGILHNIEKQNYNIFVQSPKTTTLDKYWIILSHLFAKYDKKTTF